MHSRRSFPAALGGLALAALAGGPEVAVAQVAEATLLRPRTQVISVQPISSIAGLYAAEWEVAISQSTTFGIAASAWLDEYGDDDYYGGANEDDTYYSGDLKLRYYPGAQPLQGFSFGGTLGVRRLRDRQVVDYNPTTGVARTEERTTTAPKIGFELDYNWLLGRDQRFAVALGAGAKRVIGRRERDAGGFVTDDDWPRAYPTVRMSVGIAF